MVEPFADILSIQIRDDLVVRIQGIPHDLTEQEAAKISRVIMAMSVPNPQREEGRDASR